MNENERNEAEGDVRGEEPPVWDEPDDVMEPADDVEVVIDADESVTGTVRVEE